MEHLADRYQDISKLKQEKFMIWCERNSIVAEQDDPIWKHNKR